MSDLYELTRKLVRRGCPEPGTISYHDKESCAYPSWLLMSQVGHVPVSEEVARAIWTCWALEWLLGLCRADDKSHEYIELLTWTTHKCTTLTVTYETVGEKFKPPYESCVDGDWSILEAIESATRHLEPNNAQ